MYLCITLCIYISPYAFIYHVCIYITLCIYISHYEFIISPPIICDVSHMIQRRSEVTYTCWSYVKCHLHNACRFQGTCKSSIINYHNFHSKQVIVSKLFCGCTSHLWLVHPQNNYYENGLYIHKTTCLLGFVYYESYDNLQCCFYGCLVNLQALCKWHFT